MNGANRQRAQKRHLLGFADQRQTVGLLKVTGELGQQFVGRNPDAGREFAAVVDGSFQISSQRQGVLQTLICGGALRLARYINVGLFHTCWISSPKNSRMMAMIACDSA